MKILFLTAITTAACALFPVTTLASHTDLEVTEDQQEISVDGDVSAQAQHYNYNFGRVSVNRSASTTFTLRNRGNFPIYINSIRVDGDGFNERDNCSRLLLRGNSCSIRVRFEPRNEGRYNGQLKVDLTPNEDIRVDLRGRGVRGNRDGGGDWGLTE